MDISEESIRQSAIYDIKISNRKNLFEIFNANNTMNSVNKTHIACGDNTLDWLWGLGSINCKKEKNDKEEIPVSDEDVRRALDFIQDRGLHYDMYHDQFKFRAGTLIYHITKKIQDHNYSGVVQSKVGN